MAVRRPRRSVVVVAGGLGTSDRAARALAESLDEIGIATTYLGREERAGYIAAFATEEKADAIELCLEAGGRGVLLLRELLRELIRVGRSDVSIVVHRL
jgi:methylmalonyl-CoA mutase cobalamin-binding domain/chain